MARPPLVLGTWGSITRTKRGSSWVATARFRDFDGITRKVERQGTTGRKAEDALVEHLRDRTRMHGADLTGDAKLEVLAAQWLQTLESMNLATNTIDQYRRTVNGHVMRALGSVRLREATVPVIDRYISAIVDSSGPSAGKSSRVVLNGMFSLAVRHGAIPSNPVRDVQSITIEKKEVLTFDLADVALLRQRLLEWDQGKDRGGRDRVTDLRDVVDMLLATATRTGEVLAIRWEEDLDLKQSPPVVDITGTLVHVKGHGLQRQPHPKTKTSMRGLKLPPFAVAMLTRRLTEAHSDTVFPSSTGGWRSPHNMRRQWRDFRAFYEYPEWVTPKTFRKTVATLIRDNVDIEAAKEQLGHSTSRVTEDHYAQKLQVRPDLTEFLEGIVESAG